LTANSVAPRSIVGRERLADGGRQTRRNTETMHQVSHNVAERRSDEDRTQLTGRPS
jgi:hypothetical protein